MTFSFLGEIDVAKTLLQKCLETDPNLVNAHILMAQVVHLIWSMHW